MTTQLNNKIITVNNNKIIIITILIIIIIIIIIIIVVKMAFNAHFHKMLNAHNYKTSQIKAMLKR